MSLRHLLPLLKQCPSLPSLKQIHAQMLVRSISHPNYLLSSILRFNDLSYAILHFSLHIPSPNDFSYNLLIRSLSSSPESHHVRTCLSLFLVMLRRCNGGPHRPNSFTFPFVLAALSRLPSSLPSTQSLHSLILKSSFLSHAHTAHALITAYSKYTRISCACKVVFDEITEKDIVSWNSMISGYLRVGLAEQAVGMFRRFVREEGMEKVEERMLASVIAACGEVGDLKMGKEIEAFVEGTGMGSRSSFVGSAMVDMYGKCGDLIAARRVFDGVERKEVAVWNAMITGQVFCFSLFMSISK